MSIYSDLHEQISTEALEARTRSKSLGVALIENPDDEPILGLEYVCDFRYEEEQGGHDLIKAFASSAAEGTLARERIVADGGSVSSFTQSDLVLESEELAAFAIGPVKGVTEETLKRQAETLRRQKARADNGKHLTYLRKRVPELRAEAKSRGLRNYSKLTHDGLVDLLLSDDHANSGGEETSLKSSFGTGKILWVLKSAAPVGKILERLLEAARAGHLAVRSSNAAFGQSFILFDERDESEERKDAIRRATELHHERMEDLNEVLDEVNAGPMKSDWRPGDAFYSLGHPRFDEERGEVVYFLNGHPVSFANGRSTQPSGWFTLDDLRNHRYMISAARSVDREFRNFDNRGNFRPESLTEAEAEALLQEAGLTTAIEGLRADGYEVD